MTEAEKYRLYVATFPTQWAKQFKSLRGFTEATTYNSIIDFMQTQKDDADRSKKKRKKEEESNNRRNTQRRNGGNRNNNSKIQIDQKARSGPTSKCKKHPDSNHAWGDCHLNPSNPNNKLGGWNSYRNSDRNSNTNGNYDRNNRYDRNRYQNNDNRQQRQSFYDDNRQLPPPPPRDNYSNGPPSQVSVYSNQSNNDQQGGRWSRVWIPS